MTLKNYDAICEFLWQFALGLKIIFQNSVENFEISHKTCLILVWGAVPS